MVKQRISEDNVRRLIENIYYLGISPEQRRGLFSPSLTPSSIVAEMSSLIGAALTRTPIIVFDGADAAKQGYLQQRMLLDGLVLSVSRKLIPVVTSWARKGFT